MGGAFVGVADDGSALYYNPAGIAFQPGTRFQMETVVVHGQFRFIPSLTPPGAIVPESGYDGYIHPKFIVLPNMYMTKSMGARWTAGLGVFAPFGLGANWTNFKDSDGKDTKFVARYSTSRPQLQSIWIQPTAAYRLSDRLSVAVGVAWVHTHVLLEQSILNPYDDGKAFGEQVAPKIFPGEDTVLGGNIIARLLPEGRSRFAGVSNNIGANVGLLYWFRNKKTRVGLSYRTAVVQHFDGKSSVAFTQGYALEPLVGLDKFAELFPVQDAKVSFPTPATYSIGVATTAFGKNQFSTDFQFQDYQRLTDVVLNFTQTVDTATPPELRLAFDFRNAVAVRFGWERPVKSFVIRAGVAFDSTPVPEKSVGPLWPDSTRYNFSGGFSKKLGSKEFSAFYQATQFLNRTTNVAANVNQFTNGQYNSFAQLFGFSLRFRTHGGDLEFGP
jgi:long-chain fatty acid transport protein